MPANYAHLRFGKDVFDSIETQTIKNIISKNYELYLIGLHGPDILFYHQPLKKNKIKSYGNHLHDVDAYDFFEQFQAGGDEMLAYLYGFICHFVLDSQCHGHVEECVKRTERTHYQVETGFEKYLMIHDRVDYLKINTAKHIVVNDKNCKTISEVLQIEERSVQKSLNSMKYYHKILIPGKWKDRFIRFVLTLSGQKKLTGLMLNQKTLPKDISNSIELYQLYSNAVPQALSLLVNYENYYYNKGSLDLYFKRNYL